MRFSIDLWILQLEVDLLPGPWGWERSKSGEDAAEPGVGQGASKSGVKNGDVKGAGIADAKGTPEERPLES